MEMGEKIKYWRLKRDMTLQQLGDLVGVGKSTVRKWETGMIANMRRDKIENVANALSISPGYLMGWTDDPIDYGKIGVEESWLCPDDYDGSPEEYYEAKYKADLATAQEIYNDDEQLILEAYRKASEEEKKMIRRALGVDQ